MKSTLLFIFFFLAIGLGFAQSNLYFIENKKQWEPNILFKATLPNGAAFFEQGKITYLFIDEKDAAKCKHPNKTIKDGEVMHLHSFNAEFVGANTTLSVVGEEKQTFYHNYFLGNNPEKWSTEVGLYNEVLYKNIYDGINVRYTGSGNNLKYQFELQPFADASLPKIKYNFIDDIKLENGLLKIKTSVNEIIEQAPYCYQMVNGKKQIIESKFRLKNNVVSFQLGTYDKALPLIIDPALIFCTYTGSTDDNWGTSATYDNAGNLYAAGIATGLGYPTTSGAFQTTYGGGLSSPANWNPYYGDISITKFNGTGTTAIYSTFLGGSNNDYANSLIVTNSNELIVFGRSYSNNYPTTNGCYDNTLAGDADMVVTKFNAIGNALIGSTFIGGSNADGVNVSPDENILSSIKRNYGDDARGEVNLDNAGNIYIASCTMSNDFPTTINCFDNSFSGGVEDGIILKLNPNLTQLIYSTYVGGNKNDACYSLDVDNTTNTIYVTGGTESTNFPTDTGTLNPFYLGGSSDGFLLHLNSTGTTLLQSTFIGTNQYDQSYFVKLDKNNFPYIFGQTSGTYPTTSGVYANANSGQFISRLDKGLKTLQVSTVVGNGNGSPNFSPTAFSVDKCDNVFLAGWGGVFGNTLFSPGRINNMPLTANAFKTTTDEAVQSDFYIMVLSRNLLQLSFATYYGGTGSVEHVDGGTSRFDKNGNIYGAICAGCITNDSYLQATPGAYSSTNKSANCNLAAFKMNVSTPTVEALAIAKPDTFGCAPFIVQLSTAAIAKKYIWDFNDGTALSFQQNPVHVFLKPGTYRVKLIVIDSNTCNIIDSTYTRIIATNDSVDASFTPSSTYFCYLDSVSFTSTSKVFKKTHYLWKFGDGKTSALQNPKHLYSKIGNYKVTLIVTDSFTCNKVDSISLNVTAALITVSDSFTVNKYRRCIPLTIQFNGDTTNATSFFWDFGDGSPVVANVLNPTHTYTNAGKYTAKLIAFNTKACNNTDTFKMVIDAIHVNVFANAGANTNYKCTPFTVNFTNTSTRSANFIWDFGDGSPTTTAYIPTHTYNKIGNFVITLIATDSNTCNISDTFQFNIKSDTFKVKAIANALPSNGCAPLTVLFAGQSNTTNASLLWRFEDGTTAAAVNPVRLYTDTLHYSITLIVTDTTTCNRVDSTHILIDPYYTEPFARFSIADTIGCNNLALAITNNSIGATQYFWDFGNGFSSSAFTPIYQYTNVGSYQIILIATDTNDCKKSDTAYSKADIYPTPNAVFSIYPSTLQKSDSVFSFINQQQIGVTYEWYVDNELVSTNSNYYKSWHTLGVRNICLVARSSSGYCVDSICKTVEVFMKAYIGVPNAFSPDGNGENDIFKVYGIGIDELDFRVFNRWGQLVFQTNNFAEGWDGKFNGKLQEMEVYAWTVNAKLVTGEKKLLKGNVTLVR